MNAMVAAVLKFIRDALDFKGRTSRADFWWACLALIVVGAVINVVCSLLGIIGTILGAVCDLVLFVPSLSMAFRRLHDTGKSAWWLLLGITGIGLIVLIIFWAMEGNDGDNAYGSDPRSNYGY